MGHSSIGQLFCALVLLVAGLPLEADGDWETRSNGLTSLFIVGVTIDPGDPDRVFATTRGQGLWRSFDGGVSWEKCSSGIPDQGPPYGHLLHDGVVIDHADSNVLYAVSAPSLNNGTYGRIYRSTNGGDSWVLSTAGAHVDGWYAITGVVQDPTDATHLYAGTIVSGAGGGVFESTDRGVTWANIAGSKFTADGDLGNDAWPLRIDPGNVLNLYAGSPHDAMLYSRDGGGTWTESNPAGAGADESCYEIALHPLDSSRIWIGHTDGTFLSEDAAETWDDVSATFGGNRLLDMDFAPSNAGIAYALVDGALHGSNDGGTNWALVTSQTSYGRCLAVHPTDPQRLFMGTWGRGVLRSEDGGASWEESNTGLPVDALIDIDFADAHPTASRRVFCHLRGNGLYRSEDAGEHWSFVHPLMSYYMDSFLMIPGPPDKAFYTWVDLFSSQDGGETWQPLLASGGEERFRALTFDAARNRIWIIDSHYNDTGSRLLYSRDGGERWVPKDIPGNPPLDQYMDLAIDPTDSNVLLLAAAPKWASMMENGWMYRSEDGGGAWDRIKEGLELRGWNILAGEWYVAGDKLVQNNWNGSERAALREFTAHDGTYEVRVRVTAVLDGNTQYWGGMSICRPSETSGWTQGVLVGMRRKGDVFLWADGSPRVYASNAVANASAYQTLGIGVDGDTYTLRLNGSELGSWTDPSSHWGTGSVCLCTSKARCDFDNLAVTGPPDAADDFNIGNWGNGYNLQEVAFSTTEPGVAYAHTSGEGIYRSADRGLTWERITSSDDENLYVYDILISRHTGHLFATVGSFYPMPRFETRVYSPDGSRYEIVGSPATQSYRSPLAEDVAVADILYGCQYGPGFEAFTGVIPRPGVERDTLGTW